LGARPDLRLVRADRYADWDEVYGDNVARVYRLLWSKVGNRADAEDLTADVFMTALRPMRLDVSRGEVRAYLIQVAKTTLATFWRRRLGIELTEIDLDELSATDQMPGPVVTTPTGPGPRAERVLAQLPPRYRRILELRFLEGCSVRESATAMDVSVGNAKVLQHRALTMAARILEDPS
jgi:RNA polymerase sigma-70 factor (ECF subfamily)